MPMTHIRVFPNSQGGKGGLGGRWVENQIPVGINPTSCLAEPVLKRELVD